MKSFSLMSRMAAGFALIEVLLVIGILSAITGMSVPLYRDYQIRNDLNLATEQVTQGLARARLLSQSSQNDDGWGFYVPAGVLYKGESYGDRDENFDEIYPMPSTITPMGLMEINYSKLEGSPSSTGAITLTALNDDERNVYITVEAEAVAMVENDRLSICHRTGSSGFHTLGVNESAWPAHQSHGDTLGVCPGGASSAASSAASTAQSSSRPSSSAAAVSSAAASSAVATCADRFSVAANGTITTTGTVNVTYTVLGSDITYGAGGPEINVYATYKKPTGNAYQNLFSGNDVDGGETQTVNGYTSGKQVIVKVRGYYKKSGWLTFDRTYASNDQTGHIVALRDGDSLPDYDVFDDQSSLNAYVRNILDAQGKINIGQYDVVLLTELGDLNTSSSDFQDAVILLQFSAPDC